MMGADAAFDGLLQRVREADESACRELVETYAEEIRRVVRIRLHEPLLRSMIDTTDIYQSVMMDFFVRMRLGQYEFASPHDLINLLVTMARHKLLNHSRHARVRRMIAQPQDDSELTPLQTVANSGESPGEIVQGEELLKRAAALLSADERLLADYRKQGMDWKQIAELIDDTPEAARKRFARAIDRVLTALNLRPEDL